MAQIDWNDFLVVETIDLFENEELPAPLYFDKPDKPSEKEKPQIKPVEIEEKKPKPTINVPEILPQPEQLVPLPIENDLKVKKNYVRKSGQSDNTTVRCDVCGHNIPVNEYNEHLRIELMDPRHQQMKSELTQRTQNTATASGEELSANLQIFSKKRPDIFGTVDDQVNTNDRKKNEKILWDGHSNTMTRTTANVAMLQQQTKKNFEESLKSTQEKIPPQVQQKPLPTPSMVNPPSNSLNKTLLEDVKATNPIAEEHKTKALQPNPVSVSEKPTPVMNHSFIENIPTPTPKETILNNLTIVNPLNNLPINNPNNNNNPNLSNVSPPQNNQNSNNLGSQNFPLLNNSLNLQLNPTPVVPLGIMKPPMMPLIIDSSKLVKEENINLIPEDKWLEINPVLLLLLKYF